MINIENLDIDSKIKTAILTIKTYIKDTEFDGNVYVVGGAVRDLLLGEKIKDIDIVVSKKNGGVELANLIALKDNSFELNKNPVIFENYGTAKFQFKNAKGCEGVEIECVQTRKEQYHKDSRNPDTAFGTIKEDASRRDLTINSLYYNITEDEIYDFNGNGLSDLQKNIIRTPSNPDIVFTDDPLRILRVIRFSTRLGWDIEKKTWLGMIKNAHRISIISQERITDEITKILLTLTPSIGVEKMLNCGILHRIMPDVYDLKYSYESLSSCQTTFSHTMEMINFVEPIITHRLAALFHDVGKIVTNKNKSISDAKFSSEIAAIDLKKMKFSNETINSVELAIKNIDYFSVFSEGQIPQDKKIRKFINICGKNIDLVLDLINAENNLKGYNRKPTQISCIKQKIKELGKIEEIQNIKLPINGKDIMKELNIKGGPIIGVILNVLKEKYLENPNITKEECLKIAKTKIEQMVI